MEGLDVIMLGAKLLERLPIERWLVKHDPDKELAKFERIVREYPHQQQQAAAPVYHQPSAPVSVLIEPGQTISITRQATTQDTVGATTQATVGRPVLDMPTTAETVADLKQRLGQEMYLLERDLVAGGRIANKVCDCLMKHTQMGILPMARALVPMDRSPIIDRIISWGEAHLPVFTVDAVRDHDVQYYRDLAPELRLLRKDLLGTERLSAILTPEQREQAIAKIQQAMKEEMEVK